MEPEFEDFQDFDDYDSFEDEDQVCSICDTPVGASGECYNCEIDYD